MPLHERDRFTVSEDARILGGLLERSHSCDPQVLPALAAAQAELLGAATFIVYLVDYGQAILVPLPPGDAQREQLEIDTTLAGRAFRDVRVQQAEAPEERVRWWFPLLDGSERMGVVEVVVPDDDAARQQRLRELVGLLAELLTSKSQYTDVYAVARRRQPMTLAAETQWTLLPPLTFANDRLVVTGILEPSYDIGGDSFDYAIDGGCAHLLVLDAMGHGVRSALLATAAVTAYRHSRRSGLDLQETYVAVDEAVSEQFGPESFVTAHLARFEAPTGRLEWIAAGHPAPLLFRGGRCVGPLDSPPVPPLGFGAALPGAAPVSQDRLEPGDRLLWYTDGVVEARSPDGEFFGETRLVELLTHELASGLAAPEVLRRLNRAILSHQEGSLQDDATMLLLEWRVEGDPPEWLRE